MFLLGFLIGGHVMRLCHGHDESLTIPGADKSGEEQRLVLWLTCWQYFTLKLQT